MSRFDDLYHNAINERPEQFIQPFMPYIKCKINEMEFMALIDTGSMITCMNLDTAQNCDIVKDMDDRYKISVAGVGNKQSIGKNYGVDIIINNQTIVMPITILDISLSECDLIIGLDLLRSFQGHIDFGNNLLILKSQFQTFETPLLSEQEFKLELKINKLIEICHGKTDRIQAKACLLKNNNNLDACIVELLIPQN
ncbi:Aspartyl protease [seawater metagenome]|uniref:Aspartyl protease n=1 Tax=seawater metagenome TaxID=1561972 RepID=A0A5E8CJD7_9ZZZZ